MKIYTKTGDQGSTSLLGGTRVSKAHPRIETYGTVDELNCYIGLLRDQAVNESRKDFLKEIQDRLFTIGSNLAAESHRETRKTPDLIESDVEALEKAMDIMNEHLETMRFFILPGGHQSISFGHLARVVCRRAERLCVALAEEETVESLIIKYLNRLSDYLFVLCRQMHADLQIEEIAWKPRV